MERDPTPGSPAAVSPATTASGDMGLRSPPAGAWRPMHSPAMRMAGLSAVTPRVARRRVTQPQQHTPCDAAFSAFSSQDEDFAAGGSTVTSRPASASPSHTTASSGGEASLARQRAAMYGSEEIERCGCCSKADLWLLLDNFQAMDRRGVGAVRRCDFMWALSELSHTSVDFKKTVNRGRLSAYFHGTAHELQLIDFIQRVFPAACAADLSRMQRWADLWKAHNLLVAGEGRVATDGDLQKAFDLLADESKLVSVQELVRARILARAEVSVAPSRSASSVELVDFDQFCSLARESHTDQMESEATDSAADALLATISLPLPGTPTAAPLEGSAAGAFPLALPVPVAPACQPSSPPRPQLCRRQESFGHPFSPCEKESVQKFVKRHTSLRAASLKLAS